ncbi:MAG TPA: hypothetical protein VNQ77_11015 [Frankiaceae bacterium]|nr:hypothetical protein [Frankiaceae bacterium]
MRRTLALAVSGLALAAFVAPVQSASAVCMADLSSVGGPSCFNPCYAVFGTYETADRAAKDWLPEHSIYCLH